MLQLSPDLDVGYAIPDLRLLRSISMCVVREPLPCRIPHTCLGLFGRLAAIDVALAITVAFATDLGRAIYMGEAAFSGRYGR